MEELVRARAVCFIFIYFVRYIRGRVLELKGEGCGWAPCAGERGGMWPIQLRVIRPLN